MSPLAEEPVIRGVHTMFYSSEPEALRAFLRDKLGLPHTDVGDGWLIFDLPEADMGCHPANPKEGAPSGTHDISFYCDDIERTVAELKGRKEVRMRWTALALALVCSLSCSCDGGFPTAPRSHGRLVVFVHWQDQGLPDRRLEIVELRVEQLTNSAGIADFALPAGRYTLRAYVNRGGPPGFSDQSVTMRRDATERVEVTDCLPCVSP